MRSRAIVIRIIIGLVSLYVGAGLLFVLLQTHLLYHPDQTPFHECEGFEAYSRVAHNGTRMYLKDVSDQLLVFYHGNAGIACDRSLYASFLEQTGRSIAFVEYSGYAGDGETPSSSRIMGDVRNTIDFIDSAGYTDVVVIGQSVGSGPASYHASTGDVDSLALINPFARLIDVVKERMPIYPVTILLRERYDNVEWLSGYEGDVLIMHGENDRVIKSHHSRRLYESLETSNRTYVAIEGKGHNDIWSSDAFRNRLISFARSSS